MKQIFFALGFFSFMQHAIAQDNRSNDLKITSTPASVLTNPQLKQGKIIENFNFKDLNGNTHNLASLKGKVVVLNFWFASCKPCIEEVDEFNLLVEKYKDSSVVFLSPTFEHPDICAKFIEKYGLKTLVCPDQNEYIKTLELIYYPTNIILDKDGYLFKAYSGSAPQIDKELSAEIDFLLRM
jgi:peroxiredoxin